MTEIASLYSVGDWVVHYAYGIGRIEKIEKKPINGDPVPCFQVKAQNGANWWFKKSSVENPRVRPVASPDVLLRAEEELQKPIRDLELDKNIWKNRIDKVNSDGNFIAITQIVRDLTILRTQRKLNQLEKKALSLFKERLLREWSATLDTDIEAVRGKLKHYLQKYTKNPTS
jgi:RNA polymerase-interacting CarD/CdnL/TRCF family regulator